MASPQKRLVSTPPGSTSARRRPKPCSTRSCWAWHPSEAAWRKCGNFLDRTEGQTKDHRSNQRPLKGWVSKAAIASSWSRWRCGRRPRWRSCRGIPARSSRRTCWRPSPDTNWWAPWLRGKMEFRWCHIRRPNFFFLGGVLGVEEHFWDWRCFLLEPHMEAFFALPTLKIGPRISEFPRCSENQEDPTSFSCLVTLRLGGCERFQIWIDGDPGRVLYPVASGTSESMVLGPEKQVDRPPVETMSQALLKIRQII